LRSARLSASLLEKPAEVETGLLMLGGGIVAGVFGSLLGLGGGVLIVPLLTIGFGIPIREAVGVSLICVIMTSGASAAVFLERDVANLRLGMFLELFTSTGAVIGGAIAFLLDERFIAGLLAALMLYVAVTMLRSATRAAPAASAVTLPVAEGRTTADPPDDPPIDPPASAAGTGFVARLSRPGYTVSHLPFATAGSVAAGVLSALLGIGGGIIKVPIMNLAMGVPLRVATATSNLMIGITASASAIVYLLRGGIAPYAAGPTAVGVFIGATIGSRTAHRVDVRVLRLLFVAVLLYTGYEMARRAVGMA
jgi:uncharacterized membrane protein YfcA